MEQHTIMNNTQLQQFYWFSPSETAVVQTALVSKSLKRGPEPTDAPQPSAHLSKPMRNHPVSNKLQRRWQGSPLDGRIGKRCLAKCFKLNFKLGGAPRWPPCTVCALPAAGRDIVRKLV